MSTSSAGQSQVNDSYGKFDPLAVWDTASIGNEFVPAEKIIGQQREQHERRRALLESNSWKAGMRDAQSIPKTSLQKTRSFETSRARTNSILGWCLFVLVISAAGYAVGLAVLNLKP